jgi:hypothetical protein
VERGNYQVLSAKNSQTVNQSEIASTVEPGMVLEMTIIMRESTAIQDIQGKCPRCQHINLHSNGNNGWVVWQVHLRFVRTHD